MMNTETNTRFSFLPNDTADVLAREHEAARLQREQRRKAPGDETAPPSADRNAPVDFRTSRRHRESYLSIGPDQGRFLFALARSRNARTIVEFGSSFGISTIYLAAAAKASGGSVLGSEYHPQKAEKGNRNLQEARLADRAKIVVGDARDTLKDAPDGIEILFLDGAKELYLPILKMLEPKLAASALVVADNADHLEADDPFLLHIAAPRYATSRIGFGKGAMTLSLATEGTR